MSEVFSQYSFFFLLFFSLTLSLCLWPAGGILQTVALRPPLLFGEGDNAFVPVVLRLARAGGDRLPSIGSPGEFIQVAYVGKAVTY